MAKQEKMNIKANNTKDNYDYDTINISQEINGELKHVFEKFITQFKHSVDYDVNAEKSMKLSGVMRLIISAIHTTTEHKVREVPYEDDEYSFLKNVKTIVSKTMVEKETAISELEEKVKKVKSEKKKTEKKEKKEKKLKDPSAPKRAKTAYVLFCADERPKIKAENNAKLTPQETLSELGKRWKALSAKGRAPYIKISEGEKKEYKDQMSEYVKPSDEELSDLEVNKKKPRKGSKKNDDGTKKVGFKNCFICFTSKVRSAFKLEHPEIPAVDITKMLGAKWSKMTAEEKEPYVQESLLDKERVKSETDSRVPSVKSVKDKKDKEKKSKKEEKKEEKEEKKSKKEEKEEKKEKKEEKSKKSKKEEEVEAFEEEEEEREQEEAYDEIEDEEEEEEEETPKKSKATPKPKRR